MDQRSLLWINTIRTVTQTHTQTYTHKHTHSNKHRHSQEFNRLTTEQAKLADTQENNCSTPNFVVRFRFRLQEPRVHHCASVFSTLLRWYKSSSGANFGTQHTNFSFVFKMYICPRYDTKRRI